MKSNKKRIAIISARNLKTTSDCSPETVLNLLNVIDGERYLVDIVFIDSLVPEHLRVSEKELRDLPMYVPFDDVLKHAHVDEVHELSNFTFANMRSRYQMAIVAIYNDFGEDGKILGMLDLLGIPYMNPSLKVSAVCFDKSYTKALLSHEKVSTPESFFVGKDKCNFEWINTEITRTISYPVVVKAVSSGNSWGVSLVKDSSDLNEAITKSRDYSQEILVEKYIKGQEYTVGVIGDYTNPTALPVVQINSKNDFFDYTAKYTSGKSEELCPAPVSNDLEQKLRGTAVDAYRAVKADCHARIDIMLSEDGTPYVLDINTFPGLNSASLFPKELLVSGRSLAEFVNNQLSVKSREN